MLLYIKYHDEEWGKPVYDGKKLFEFLVLDIMQAGLSFLTILRKRENLRQAFDDFDVEKISNYGEEKVFELLNNPGIIRNRKKIEAVINNASSFIEIQNEFGSFSNYIWTFVNHKPIINYYNSVKEVPTKSELSDLIAKDLKKRGFKFLGSIMIYAYIQSIGLIDDHINECNFKAREAI